MWLEIDIKESGDIAVNIPDTAIRLEIEGYNPEGTPSPYFGLPSDEPTINDVKALIIVNGFEIKLPYYESWLIFNAIKDQFYSDMKLKEGGK